MCQPAMWTREHAAFDRLGDPRQRLRAVDQHLQATAITRWWVPGGPQAGACRRLELLDSAGPFQASAMMRADCPLDGDPPARLLQGFR